MKKYLIVLVLLVVAKANFAQTPVYTINQQGTITPPNCIADFYDSGNSGAQYGNNQNFIMTFHSADAINTHVKVNFSTFSVDASDYLIVYDGPNTSAPIIGSYNNANAPPPFVMASVTNTSGDLTFQFTSDGSVTADGWFATMYCSKPCQKVMAVLSTLETVPTPDNNYIDVCFDKTITSTNTITFAALANAVAFPENNILYAQDEATSTYLWDFGDGTFGNGRVTTHAYSQVRGYDVGLTITDANGCPNWNNLGSRVRVSANPYGRINPISDLCSGTDTTYVSIGYGNSSVITISPIGSVQSSKQLFDSTMFIPDGPNCSVMCYNTFVAFTAFPGSATIQSGNDILGICVNMEHSFAGDLGFRIICPNGQSVQLDPNTHSGGAFMGVPNGGISHETYDNGCLPANNPYGVGWTYCWSQIYPTHGTLDALSSGGVSPIDSTNTVTHTNYIQPNNSLNGLIGCPLNGTWNIEICDDYGIDNGYIFWWSMELDPSLLPVSWSYSVPIDTITWTGSFINTVNDSTIMIIPGTGDTTFSYTVTVYDVFGCSYDTTFVVQVVQTPLINLGSDTTACSNNVNILLDAGAGMSNYLWDNGSNGETYLAQQTGTYSVTVTNTNIGNTIQCTDRDSIYIKALALPVVELGPDQCSTIPITLDAGNAGMNMQYVWSNNATTQTTHITSSGTYSVSVAEEFGFGCEVIDQVVIVIKPEPIIDAGPDQNACRHNNVILGVSDQGGLLGASGDYTYMWSFNPSIEGAEFTPLDQQAVTLTWMYPGTYTATVRVTGCTTVKDSLTLVIEPCDLTVPNVITPNGDGQNDFFKIPNIEFYPNSTMIIYNRWGEKVYKNENYENNWDGGNCAAGVYYYIFTINYGAHSGKLETKAMNGIVTILK
jgi:gliding motility-associated-like protein